MTKNLYICMCLWGHLCTATKDIKEHMFYKSFLDGESNVGWRGRMAVGGRGEETGKKEKMKKILHSKESWNVWYGHIYVKL